MNEYVRAYVSMCACLCARPGPAVSQAASSLRKQNKHMVTYLAGTAIRRWTSTLSEPNRTKHIDVAYHHIREWVKLGAITILPVETSLQLADAMTKALPRPQHEFLLGKYCGEPLAF